MNGFREISAAEMAAVEGGSIWSAIGNFLEGAYDAVKGYVHDHLGEIGTGLLLRGIGLLTGKGPTPPPY